MTYKAFFKDAEGRLTADPKQAVEVEIVVYDEEGQEIKHIYGSFGNVTD